MKILFSTSSLFPYRVNWLDELGKYADLDVYYLMESDNARNKEWCLQRPQNCKYTLMKGRKFPGIGIISFEFIKILKKHSSEYDAIILDGYGFPSQLLNIKYLNNHKISYYVNIDGMVPKDKENKVIYLIKKHIVSRIPYCLCGAYATNKILMNYGTHPENIINHPFTSLYKRDIDQTITNLKEKKNLRKKLGMKEDKVIISVGRFSYMNGYGKGYDVLLRSAQNMDPTVGWYIIGGKPTEEFAKMKKDMQLENVHFVEFLNKEELAQYYRASDVFVLMTVGDVWGLVINEAMAHGLPVITTNKCVAGLDLIENDKNGYIVDVGDDNTLSKRLEHILEDPTLMEDMGKQSLKKISEYTIENMANIHINAIKKIEAKKEKNSI